MNRDTPATHVSLISWWILLATTALLTSVAITVRLAEWQQGVVMHTMLELAATLLAFMIGVVALIRFCTRQETLHLFIGVGFLGAALFDGQHMILTSPWWLAQELPSEHWTWNPSSTFLALELVFGWWACRREQRVRRDSLAPDDGVYLRLAIVTLVSFAIAAFVPFPRRYAIEGLLGRPDELLAGLLFLIAMLGFMQLSERSPSVFLRWLILALLISFVGRVFVMSRSSALLDALFMIGHWAKLMSYVCVLVGLLADFYSLSAEAQRRQESLAQAVNGLRIEAAQRERAQGEALAAHQALESRAAELASSRAAALNAWQDLEISRTQAVLAEQATRDQAARTQAILDGASDAIITITSDGEIESFNAAAEQMFGYKAAEAIGKNVKFLMPPPYRDEHDQYLRNYLESGISKIIGIGREVVGRRADGSTFPMHLGVSEVKLNDQRMFTGIVRDISDLREAMQQLTTANDELARRSRLIEQFNVNLSRSNEELKQFAYIASHDLQEPLRKVTAFCQLLRDDYGDRLDENAQTYIQYAVDGALRMKTLVQDLLSYSRVETQGKPLEATSADDAFAEAIDNLSMVIEETGATITCDELPVVHADRAQLARLFQNLIGNAIKYRGDEPPCIHVGVTESNGTWQFCVQDNGIGIEPQHYERIFVIFQRLHGRDEYSGTGIGLAVCKRIVERAGGRIWVESNNGAGSTFYFTLSKAISVEPQGTPNNDRHSPHVVSSSH